MVNKVILIGNLGQDPDVKYTQSGTAVATLNIATTRKRKGQDGNYVDETDWHRVVAWSKTADFCGDYLKKGSKIYVEGRLQTRKWQAQDGIDRYTTEVIVENLQNLTPRQGNSQGGYEPPSTGDDVPF